MAATSLNMNRNVARKKRRALPENPHDRFVRLVVPRVRNAIHAIELVGKCSNRKTGYEYSDEEAERIMTALSTALQRCNERFASANGEEELFDLNPEE